MKIHLLVLVEMKFFCCCCLSSVDDTLDQGQNSRPETRQSERSLSRQSGRSSIELDAAPALDYANLEQSGADDDEADQHLSDNEVDQFLQSLKETGKVCNPIYALLNLFNLFFFFFIVEVTFLKKL